MPLEARTNDYWIAPNAITITLNALGEPNRIQGSVVSGAVVSCYIEAIKPATAGPEYKDNGDGLQLDNGRNPRRWPLSLSPTYFNTNTPKYVYAAIPRSASVGTTAVIVFPSDRIDLYGQVESTADDGSTVVTQVGSTDYFYIFLRGILSSSGDDGKTPRVWTQDCEWGSLGTYADIIEVKNADWYEYDAATQIATFLKNLTMRDGTTFLKLFAEDTQIKIIQDLQRLVFGSGDSAQPITGVAVSPTDDTATDKIVTPAYLDEFGNTRYLSKVHDDTAAGTITFLKGLLFGDGSHGITAQGNALLNNVNAIGDADIDGVLRSWAGVFANLIESDNFSGDWQDVFGSGFQMRKGDDGITSLVVDNLFVRMKAIFTELEIRKISYAGGNIIFSHAGSKVVLVKTIYSNGADFSGDTATVGDSMFRGDTLTVNSGAVFNGDTLQPDAATSTLTAYRCYLLADDGTTRTENWWRVDDQARCQTFNIQEGVYQNVSNTFYWRRVMATGSEVLDDGKTYDYVDLSVIDCVTGSTEPQAGDQLVQMGNRTDAERQGFIIIEVSGDLAPAFKVYKGVNSYSLDDKRKICISPKYTELRVQKLVQETEYDIVPVPMQRSEAWYEGMHCYYYDLVQHNGATWLCIYPESGIGGVPYTTEEPSDDAVYWRVYAREGAQGETGESAYDVLVLGADKITNGQGGIQLEARAYYGGDDVSDTLLKAAWSWQRETLSGNNTASDNAWNAQHRGYGPQLYIANTEVLRRALFTCEVDFSKTKTT